MPKVRQWNRANRLQTARPRKNLQVNRVDEKKDRKIYAVDTGEPIPQYFSQVGTAQKHIQNRHILSHTADIKSGGQMTRRVALFYDQHIFHISSARNCPRMSGKQCIADDMLYNDCPQHTRQHHSDTDNHYTNVLSCQARCKYANKKVKCTTYYNSKAQIVHFTRHFAYAWVNDPKTADYILFCDITNSNKGLAALLGVMKTLRELQCKLHITWQSLTWPWWII